MSLRFLGGCKSDSIGHFDIVLFDELVEAGPAQAGYFAGLFDVSACHGHQFLKVLPFHPFKDGFPSLLQRGQLFWRSGFVILGDSGSNQANPDVRGQVFGIKYRLVDRSGDGTFQGIDQFPDVPGPVIGAKGL